MYKRNEEERKCLSCGKTLYGRSDKKFCNDKCRSIYHNKNIRVRNYYIDKTINHLYRNYSILNKVLAEGKVCVDLAELKSIGFDCDTVSCYIPGRKNISELRCFDIQYRQSPMRIFKIKRIEPRKLLERKNYPCCDD